MHLVGFIHHHHIYSMELGHLLTRSGLTYPEVYSNVYRDSFCQLVISISVGFIIRIYHDARSPERQKKYL
jgi:hypothetical protein